MCNNPKENWITFVSLWSSQTWAFGLKKQLKSGLVQVGWIRAHRKIEQPLAQWSSFKYSGSA